MQKISRNSLTFCGIYMLINLVNGKRYIGSSINVAQRLWEHRSTLRHNKHSNAHLQKAWNKYGEGAFEYQILEKCQEDDRFEREQFYVNTLNPEYNICKDVVQNPPVSEETRKKHSETRKKLMAEGKIPITNNKPVYVYYKDGSFVGYWESVRQAAKALNIHYSGAYRVIQGVDFQTSGYRFFREKQESVAPFRKRCGGVKKGTALKEYAVTDGITTIYIQGVENLAKHFNTTCGNIRQYINSHIKRNGIYKIYLHCRIAK